LHQTYEHIIGKLVNMIINPTPWILKHGSRGGGEPRSWGAEEQRSSGARENSP
jgi:hypothetical protein